MRAHWSPYNSVRTRLINFNFNSDFNERQGKVKELEDINECRRHFVHICLLGRVNDRFYNGPLLIVQDLAWFELIFYRVAGSPILLTSNNVIRDWWFLSLLGNNSLVRSIFSCVDSSRSRTPCKKIVSLSALSNSSVYWPSQSQRPCDSTAHRCASTRVE